MSPLFFQTIALVLSTLTNAHLIMENPVPFGVDTLDNSPLENAWPGNYPCKQRPGVYKTTKTNQMTVGEPQKLSFSGSASHGGGTCQLAVTLDLEPTPNSIFKIIHVFEGGCPTSGTSGTDAFTFTIPSVVPSGSAVFAWFWNNRIGNREAYMNCAPIEVSGGASDPQSFESLPNLYRVNLPSSDCEGPEGSDVRVPHAGDSVDRGSSAKPAAATGPGCKALADAQIAGIPSGSNAVQRPKAHVPGNDTATTTPPSTTRTFNSPLSGSIPESTAQPPYLYSPGSNSTGAAEPSFPPSASSSLPAASAAPPISDSAACTSSSPLICSQDGTHFALCPSSGGQTAVWQRVAAGTRCRRGAIVKRGVGMGAVRGA